MAVAKARLLSAAKRAISAAVRNPPKGGGVAVADNGSVPLPETVLPQTPFGFPLLRQTK